MVLNVLQRNSGINFNNVLNPSIPQILLFPHIVDVKTRYGDLVCCCPGCVLRSERRASELPDQAWEGLGLRGLLGSTALPPRVSWVVWGVATVPRPCCQKGS